MDVVDAGIGDRAGQFDKFTAGRTVQKFLRRVSFWDGYFSAWRIVTSSVSAPDDIAYETPPEMVAYAPAWRPDGRALAFTGYRVGDPGWGVYVKDLGTGALTRIAAGENPSWRKDGRMLVYERDGMVYKRGLP